MTIAELAATRSYFTAQDKDITSTGARDPLGFEALWSYLGRQVFDNKITSIANDIRNYTLNLVHHAVVKRLYEDGSLHQLKERLAELYNYDALTEEQAVVATIIFLENLSIYAMVKAPNGDDSFELTGLLGISKGRSAPLEKIWISPTKDAFILVNQANVGLNARYKTPFTKMRLFGPSYDYHYDSEGKPTAWPEREEIEEEFWELRERLVELIRRLLSHGTVSPLEIDLSKPTELVSEIAFRYGKVFRLRRMERFPRLCQFWKRSLGLDRAPVSFIYDEVKRHKPDSMQPELVGTVIQQAAQEADDSNLVYFKAIQETEKVIAPVRFIFDLLLSGQYDHFDSEELQAMTETARVSIPSDNSTTFVRHFRGVEGQPERRAQAISEVAQAPTSRVLIERLVAYHNEIMHDRQNVPWIRDENGKIRILAGMMGRKPNVVYPWFHTYYVDSLSSITDGLGSEA